MPLQWPLLAPQKGSRAEQSRVLFNCGKEFQLTVALTHRLVLLSLPASASCLSAVLLPVVGHVTKTVLARGGNKGREKRRDPRKRASKEKRTVDTNEKKKIP